MNNHSIKHLKTVTHNAIAMLRGPVDASQYLHYIARLIVLKRASDVFDEKGENNPLNVIVPAEAHWNSIIHNEENIAERLNNACKLLENENPGSFAGVLTIINFNEISSDDPKKRDEIIFRLLQLFSSITLKDEDCGGPENIGHYFTSLLDDLARISGKSIGASFTPPSVRKGMVALLKPTEGMRIADPFTGSAGLLFESARFVQAQGGDPHTLSYSGQEINQLAWSIAKMNAFMHGFTDADIRHGNSLTTPHLLDNGRLQQFDGVIADPPFGLKHWDREFAEIDPYGRFIYGVPPKSRGDFTIIEHSLAMTKPTGKTVIVTPQGVLFRGGIEGEIRKNIVTDDILEAVIVLPPRLFYYTGISTALLVFNKDKSSDRKEGIFFIDASQMQLDRDKSIKESDIKLIIDTFKENRECPGFSRFATIREIEKNDFNLTVSLYVESASEIEQFDLPAAMEELHTLDVRKQEIIASLLAKLCAEEKERKPTSGDPK